jgi:hypothetical protein
MDSDSESSAPSTVAATDFTVDADHLPRARPWLTLGLSLVAVIVYVIAASIVASILLSFEVWRNPKTDIDAWLEQFDTNGDLLSLSTWAATIVVVPLVLLFARMVSGPFAGEHLGLRRPCAKSMARWILAALVFFAASDGLTIMLGRELIPDWMRETYAATRHPILLWLTLVVAAPVGEELLFRGFLFDGLARSRVGPVAAAIITALAWASIHIQYDLSVIGRIFLSGLLLAAARQLTRSVMPCIAIHAVQNLISTLEVVLLN